MLPGNHLSDEGRMIFLESISDDKDGTRPLPSMNQPKWMRAAVPLPNKEKEPTMPPQRRHPSHSRAFEKARRFSNEAAKPTSPTAKLDDIAVLDAESQRRRLRDGALQRQLLGPSRLRRFDSADFAIRRRSGNKNSVGVMPPFLPSAKIIDAPSPPADVKEKQRRRNGVARRQLMGPKHLQRFDSADFFSKKALRELDEASAAAAAAAENEEDVDGEDARRNMRQHHRISSLVPRSRQQEKRRSLVNKTKILNGGVGAGEGSTTRSMRAPPRAPPKRRSVETNRVDLRRSLGRQATERRLRAHGSMGGGGGQRRNYTAHRLAERQLLGPAHLRRFDSADFFSKKALADLDAALTDSDSDENDGGN